MKETAFFQQITIGVASFTKKTMVAVAMWSAAGVSAQLANDVAEHKVCIYMV